MKRYIRASWPEPLTYNEFEEGDQIINTFIDVCDELNVTSEPSARGGHGSDFFYDENGEELAEIDLDQERLELENLYDSSKSKSDFKRKVKKWLKDLISKGSSESKYEREQRKLWNSAFTYNRGSVVSDQILEYLEDAAYWALGGGHVALDLDDGGRIANITKFGDLMIKIDLVKHKDYLYHLYDEYKKEYRDSQRFKSDLSSWIRGYLPKELNKPNYVYKVEGLVLL